MVNQGVNISISSLNKSPKKEGKYERDIIKEIANFLKNNNYKVREHVSLNIAWSNVLYELDVIGIRENEVTIVEVKSKKDRIMKAKTQMDILRGFADYAYVASDLLIESSNFKEDIGIMFIHNNEVFIIRNAKKISDPITKDMLMKLKKKCVIKLCGNDRSYNKMNKQNLVNLFLNNIDKEDLKVEVKNIVFCSQRCSNCLIGNEKDLSAP